MLKNSCVVFSSLGGKNFLMRCLFNTKDVFIFHRVIFHRVIFIKTAAKEFKHTALIQS